MEIKNEKVIVRPQDGDLAKETKSKVRVTNKKRLKDQKRMKRQEIKEKFLDFLLDLKCKFSKKEYIQFIGTDPIENVLVDLGMNALSIQETEEPTISWLHVYSGHNMIIIYSDMYDAHSVTIIDNKEDILKYKKILKLLKKDKKHFEIFKQNFKRVLY